MIPGFKIRIAQKTDYTFLKKLEEESFPIFQRSSQQSLRLSLTSHFQEVWIAEVGTNGSTAEVGAIIVHKYRKTLRIYSVAVLPKYQKKGIGQKLIKHIHKIALENSYENISLEVNIAEKYLVNWYLKIGFNIVEKLVNYYGDNINGLRMIMPLLEKPRDPDHPSITNIIVVDNAQDWNLHIDDVKVISAKSYLAESRFNSLKNARVFNMCSNYSYQSFGYYVSLLASAREHRAIPNVTTIRDFKSLPLVRAIASDIDEAIQKSLKEVNTLQLTLNIYFGQTVNEKYKILGQQLYNLFETPLLQVSFSKTDRWNIKKIQPVPLKKISAKDIGHIQDMSVSYFSKKRFRQARIKHYKYDLAILVNPNEQYPPSDHVALKRFKTAAERMGFHSEFITREDYNRIYEFDALFIRETTSVNNHTYKFSRMAYAEGLVVIDDPWSILRCSNKIYLSERMGQNKIITPETWILDKNSIRKPKLEIMSYPLVLKQPDSAFSLGVNKVNNEEELYKTASEMLKHSDLIIAQEFLPSEFDWRIGLLDQKPIFACKYYMAKGHWQIYNWNSRRSDRYGTAESVPIDNVPSKILETAVKASSLIGDGLYGVDLKNIGNKVYLIEINDNPNIDAGIEDSILKEELYNQIINSILSRIEIGRDMSRFVSTEPVYYKNKGVVVK